MVRPILNRGQLVIDDFAPHRDVNNNGQFDPGTDESIGAGVPMALNVLQRVQHGRVRSRLRPGKPAAGGRGEGEREHGAPAGPARGPRPGAEPRSLDGQRSVGARSSPTPWAPTRTSCTTPIPRPTFDIAAAVLVRRQERRADPPRTRRSEARPHRVRRGSSEIADPRPGRRDRTARRSPASARPGHPVRGRARRWSSAPVAATTPRTARTASIVFDATRPNWSGPAWLSAHEEEPTDTSASSPTQVDGSTSRPRSSTRRSTRSRCGPTFSASGS